MAVKTGEQIIREWTVAPWKESLTNNARILADTIDTAIREACEQQRRACGEAVRNLTAHPGHTNPISTVIRAYVYDAAMAATVDASREKGREVSDDGQ